MTTHIVDYLYDNHVIDRYQFNYLKKNLLKKSLQELIEHKQIMSANSLLFYMREFLVTKITTIDFENLRAVELQNFQTYVNNKFILCLPKNNLINSNYLIVTERITDQLINKILNDYSNMNFNIIITDNFTKFLQKSCQKLCLYKAINQFDHIFPNSAARKLDIFTQTSKHITLFSITFCISPYIFYGFVYIFSIISSSFKFILYLAHFFSKPAIINILPDNFDYPIYSVLVPLYNEANKVKSIIKAMTEFDYPQDRLEIKILVEEVDNLTIKALAIVELPTYIEVIIIPAVLPQTKPKALNYGLQFITGKYVAIYDAEDIPDRQQLKKACAEFAILPENYVCLQASLIFYNSHENLLTKFFTLEYYILFNFLMKGLSYFNLPIPLGGTSNHFKVDFLRKIYGWDAYNVTEDAEIGIRIHMKGYKIKMLESITLEESVIDSSAWLYQRARWIKGFIITYLIYKKNYSGLQKNNFWSNISISIFLGIGVLNFLLLPIYCIISLMNEQPELEIFLRDLSVLIYIAYCYLTAINAIINMRKNFLHCTFNNIIVIIIWPLYFIMHSFASWLAVYELLAKPYKWNKTMHGTSKLKTGLDD